MKESDIEVVENPDGTATINLNIDTELKRLILTSTGRKRLTKKLVEDFVLSAVQKHLEMTDEPR